MPHHIKHFREYTHEQKEAVLSLLGLAQEPTPEEIGKAYTAMVKTYNTEETRTQLEIDTQKLTDNVVKVQTAFSYIAKELKQVDNLHLHEPFSTKWEELFGEFQTVLQESKQQAATIIATCAEFDSTIMRVLTDQLGGPPLPVADKIKILNSYLERVKRHEDESFGLATKFDKMAFNLNAFSGEFAEFAKERHESDTERIKELDAGIARLNEEISSVTFNISVVALTMGVTAFGTATLCAIFPVAIPFILLAGAVALGGQGVALGVLLNRREGLYQDRTRDQDEKTRLEKELDLITETETRLKTLGEKDISTITDTLPSFTTIWNSVALTCVQIRNSLEGTEDVIDWPTVVALYLEEGTTMIGILGTAMTDYVTGVTNGEKIWAKSLLFA